MPVDPLPLTPRRRAMKANFSIGFTPEQQAAIRADAERRGVDYLEDLFQKGKIGTPLDRMDRRW